MNKEETKEKEQSNFPWMVCDITKLYCIIANQ